MTKWEKLKNLKKRMEEDKSLPLREGAVQLVFGEGNPDAEIYLLGEAPGRVEDKTGRPFVGNSGKLLNKSLESIGIKREDVYITSVVRYRPPENRSPKPQEILAFAPYVDEEIEIIDPKIIVTLGRFSMEKFLPDKKISEVHGKVFKINWKGKEKIIIPMFHPAATLRREDFKKLFEKDFKYLGEYIKQLNLD